MMTEHEKKPTTDPIAKHDFKLGASLLKFAMASIDEKTTISALVPIEKIFANNVERLRSTILLPTLVTHFSGLIERSYARAELEITGAISKAFTAPSSIKGIGMRSSEILREYMPEIASADQVGKHFSASYQRLSVICNAPTDPITLGMEAMLSSLILGMWTSFETLAGDLWETAINIHPAGLAELKGKGISQRLGKFRFRRKELREDDASENLEDKKVSLNLIQMHQFDLRSKMGTILREQYKFDRLDHIRYAYGAAFFEKSTRIDTALKDKKLDALSAVRNVIVHRAGIADEEYIKRSGHLEIPTAELGRPIMLDGENVLALVTGALDCATELIYSVQEWLEKN